MDLWFIIKENYILLSFFAIIILISVVFLVAALKRRSEIPMRLLTAIMIVCGLLIFGALFMMTFIVSFGYNS